jgi:hypothetical protein
MSNDGAGVPDHEATPQRAKGIVLFVVTFAIFLAGFWIMAVGFDQQSGLIFGGGILASTLGVILPSILEP